MSIIFVSGVNSISHVIRIGGFVALGLWLALSGTAMAQERARGAPNKAGCATSRRADVLAEVMLHGDLKLRSGLLVKLADIRLPDGPADRDRVLAHLRSFLGADVTVDLGGSQDRWGRHAGIVTVADRQTDMARELIRAGLALVDAGEREDLCRPDLLAAEAEARQEGLGLWAGDGYKPLTVGDLTRLKQRIGRFTLVEGRIRSVGERRQRIYLNFGRDWQEDFTITIPQRTWLSMSERGMSAATLSGRQIRVRGILEEWQGPVLNITAPTMIEVLDQERTRR